MSSTVQAEPTTEDRARLLLDAVGHALNATTAHKLALRGVSSLLESRGRPFIEVAALETSAEDLEIRLSALLISTKALLDGTSTKADDTPAAALLH